MRFTIHDVGHGFCAHLKHDNGNVILWDCGHKVDPEHRPSQFLPASGIHTVYTECSSRIMTKTTSVTYQIFAALSA